MIVSAPVYWLTCDTCAESSEQGGDYMAWISGEVAVANAEGFGWAVTSDGRHFCVAHAGDSPVQRDLEGAPDIPTVGAETWSQAPDSADKKKP